MSGHGWTKTWSLALAGLALLAAAATGQVPADVEDDPSSPVHRWLEDEQVQPVAYDLLQPPPSLSAPGQPGTSAARRSTSSRTSNVRLASAPNMFGDVGMLTATVAAQVPSPAGQEELVMGTIDIPAAGGSRRVKIGENSKAMPDDRFYFMYNHFHNVYEIEETRFIGFPPTTTVTQRPIDRYTIGVEKMFWDDWWSVEVRMPFNSAIDEQLDVFGVSGGNVGNLAAILKRLCYRDEALAVAIGVGIDTPTGSDSQALIGPFALNFDNQALHVLPFAGFAYCPSDAFFMNGFIQVDIATSGLPVTFENQFNQTGPLSLGEYNEQNLLYLDLSFGYWLVQNEYATYISGLAAFLEFHYTTALQDTDVITLGADNFVISNPVNRFDVVNTSVGVQLSLQNYSNLRVAGVFPLGTEPDNRFFDAEVQVQFNQRF